MIIACATDDGTHFMDRHFGDALYYDLYELSAGGFHFLERIDNTTEEEEGHADPKKARGIVNLLKERGVEAGLTKVFGPNIKRIKKQILPILISEEVIEAGLEKVMKNYDTAIGQLLLCEDREHLDLRR
ncbi:MAG: dinitrogenase iron-molybdenum cofactor biosynthesis protein [delta proteobacterium ML8_F1]|nr:MAG: dinitrogenase iron-molybdenum cofactor biosynthesis protein [delta proteobacterium ML8_F1]